MLLEFGYYIDGLKNEINRSDREFCLYGEPGCYVLRWSVHCNES